MTDRGPLVTALRISRVSAPELTSRFFSPPYWASKVVVPITLGGAVAIASCVTVLVIDPEHSVQRFTAALLVIPVVAVGASAASIGIATLSVGLRDPYLISNVVHGLLPLTAGVIVPLASYPAALAGMARAFPLTGAIEAMQAITTSGSGAWVASTLGREVLICGAWFVLGALASRLVIRGLRNGRREEIW